MPKDHLQEQDLIDKKRVPGTEGEEVTDAASDAEMEPTAQELTTGQDSEEQGAIASAVKDQKPTGEQIGERFVEEVTGVVEGGEPDAPTDLPAPEGATDEIDKDRRE